MDLALNKLQWLICHKTKPNQERRAIPEHFCCDNTLTLLIKLEKKF